MKIQIKHTHFSGTNTIAYLDRPAHLKSEEVHKMHDSYALFLYSFCLICWLVTVS